MAKKALYCVILLLTLVYLGVVVNELSDPFYASKSEMRGDLSNSLLFSAIQILQIDFGVLLLLRYMMNRDIKNNERVFFAGIVAMVILAGISIKLLFSGSGHGEKSLAIVLFYIAKSVLTVYLSAATLRKVIANW